MLRAPPRRRYALWACDPRNKAGRGSSRISSSRKSTAASTCSTRSYAAQNSAIDNGVDEQGARADPIHRAALADHPYQGDPLVTTSSSTQVSMRIKACRARKPGSVVVPRRSRAACSSSSSVPMRVGAVPAQLLDARPRLLHLFGLRLAAAPARRAPNHQPRCGTPPASPGATFR